MKNSNRINLHELGYIFIKYNLILLFVTFVIFFSITVFLIPKMINYVYIYEFGMIISNLNILILYFGLKGMLNGKIRIIHILFTLFFSFLLLLSSIYCTLDFSEESLFGLVLGYIFPFFLSFFFIKN